VRNAVDVDLRSAVAAYRPAAGEERSRCAAWLTPPRALSSQPAIVLAHGFRANPTMSLDRGSGHDPDVVRYYCEWC
jgi:hypothetical protein